MYVIARHSKIKSLPELRAALKHNCREQPTPNADPARAALNGGESGTVAQALARYRSALGDHKPRKNAVHAVEYMFSASPEWFNNKDPEYINKYFKDCALYVADKYGKNNIVSIKYHYDETTPHCHVIVIPMHNNKLNAKHYIGGTKAVAQQFQHDIGLIGNKYGLTRGIEGSRATHTTIKEFNKIVSQVGGDPQKALELMQAGKKQNINQKTVNALKTKNAQILKDANKKVAEAKAAETRSRAALLAVKTELSELKQTFKDQSKEHDNNIKEMQKEIQKLNNELVKSVNRIKRVEDKAKKAEINAEAAWKIKNADYLNNIEKDREANIINREINIAKEQELDNKEDDLNRRTAAFRAEKADSFDNAADILKAELLSVKQVTPTVIKLPPGVVLSETMQAEIESQIAYQTAKQAREQIARKALEDEKGGEPMPTHSPETERRTRRKSGLSM